MKKKILLIAAVLLACVAVYTGFLLLPKHASDINTYDISAVTRIDIDDIKANTTINIDTKDKIEDIVKLLKNDYEVRKIDKAREGDILVTTPPILTVTLLGTENLAVVDQYILTSFNTIAIPDTKTMVGSQRTQMYESVKEQQEIFDTLRKIISESE